jgi:hypothetical protein
MKAILSFLSPRSGILSREAHSSAVGLLSRAAHLSPRSGIYRPSGLLSPAGHFTARSAFIRPRSGFIARSAFILFIALALGACATEEVLAPAQSDDPATAIVFGTFLDKAPQAAAAQSGIKPLASVLTTTGLQAYGFTVLAYSTDYTAWSEYYSTAPATPNFMNNVAVTWDSDHWTYAGTQYWPNTSGTEWSNVSFFSYSTVNGATATGVANGNPEIAFETQAAAASQVDLVADTDLDLTAESNAGRVKFAFDHILSRIGFSAKLSTAHAGATVTVKSLKVYYKSGEVASNGTYTFNTTTNTDADNWTLDDATFFANGEGDQIFTGAATLTAATATNLSAPDAYLMLIPQAVEGGDVYVVLDYDVDNGSTTENKTPSIDLPATTWTPGKSYTYNFLLSFDPAVGFDTETSVNPWDDTKAVDIPPQPSIPTPEHAASTNTWEFGNSDLVWSDRILVPECSDGCSSNEDNGTMRYYYNWEYVANEDNAAAMCPDPWRVPTKDDFDKLTNSGAIAAAWGYGGGDMGELANITTDGYYWSSTEKADEDEYAYYLYYNSSSMNVTPTPMWYEFQVRCVR